MEQKTIKTILLMIGSAFVGVTIFVVAVVCYVAYISPNKPGESVDLFHSTTRVSMPPPIKNEDETKFLGSSGIQAGRYVENKNVLDAGTGQIAGNISASSKPVSGQKIRLVLNGAVVSQWAETDAVGKYSIRLPPGKYQVSGYKLDSYLTDKKLAGKLESPQNEFQTGIFNVSATENGRGLDLDYVDPVIKQGPTEAVKVSSPVVISWKPYPRAAKYRLQVTEWNKSRDYVSQRHLFDFSARPEIKGVEFNLTTSGVPLVAGKYYVYSVEALDATGKAISTTANHFDRFDFYAVD